MFVWSPSPNEECRILRKKSIKFVVVAEILESTSFGELISKNLTKSFHFLNKKPPAEVYDVKTNVSQHIILSFLVAKVEAISNI